MSKQIDGQTLDEGLYSRQLYVYGADAMRKMSSSKVLIIGDDGLAIEIAKNLILSGVHSLTIMNNDPAITHQHLSTNYLVSENDLGKRFSEICISKLAELNQNVKVSFDSQNHLYETLSNFNVVVSSNQKQLEEQKELDRLVRDRGAFIMCNTFGLFGNVFCDFGNEFIIKDQDGEEPKNGVIVSSSLVDNKDTLITVAENHGLASDDCVKFTFDKDLSGPASLDGSEEQYSIKYVDQTNFKILDHHISPKRFSQSKQPKIMNFNSLENSLNKPEFVHLDFCSPGKSDVLHTLYQAKTIFEQASGIRFENWNDNHSKQIVELATSLDSKFDKDLGSKYANVLSGQLAPISSVIGSLVAQEVLKACSHKYTPFYQWFYFEAFNSIPESRPSNTKSSDRYCEQNELFGTEFQTKLANSKLFIVGSGAIGCEHLKNFAMMGVGDITVTDMDTIERSNLSRQFLFRTNDIGKLKSDVACKKAHEMNPLVKITSHQNKVGQETTNIYNEEFFKNLTCVANALDNVQARMFVDSLCVMHKKPLLESGTLGTKCNVQTVIPFLTESYGSSVDPPEKSIPICTLKDFPYEIEHTIQWARDLFQGYFANAPQNAIKFLENASYLRNLPSGELNTITNDIKNVLSNVPTSFESCLNTGYKTFHELYRDRIVNLVHKFAPDSVNTSGVPFWSGTKKCPTALTFDVSNKSHFGFVYSYAMLWAQLFDVKVLSGEESFSYLFALQPYNYSPQEVHISTNEEEEKKYRKELEDSFDVEKMIVNLSSYNVKNVVIRPLEFEKDDDTNHHIDFITSASNLRASNYAIPEADRFKTKGIAGKIIPAIATTTGLVSGLVALEFYKLLFDNKLETYRNWFCNIGLPYLGYSEPMPAKKQKIGKLEFTFWESFEFHNNPTLGQIIDYYQNKYELDLSTIAYGQAMLISQFMPLKRRQERLNKTVYEIIKEINQKDEPGPVSLALIFSSDDDDESDEPPTCKVYYN